MPGDFDVLRDQQQVIPAGRTDPNLQIPKRKTVRHERILMFDRRISPHRPQDFSLRILESQLELVLALAAR